MLDVQIIAIVRKLERSFGRGIFPWMVQPWLDAGYCEQTLRRHMVRMWQQGQLHRVGGPKGRRGYRVAAPGSRLRFPDLTPEHRAQLRQRLAAFHARQFQTAA